MNGRLARREPEATGRLVCRRHAARLNARNRSTGHVWQGRYGSVVMDKAHLYHAFAHVSLNPLRAGLVSRAQDWPWSSARSHLTGQPDGITTLYPAQERVGDFAALLGAEPDQAEFERLRRAEITGRPVGGEVFSMDWNRGSAGW